MTNWVDKVNDRVARSRIGKYFQLENSGHRRERKGTKFMTEVRAGVTVFFAMVTCCFCFHVTNRKKKKKAYIISVNASIISETGGTCICEATTSDPTCDNDSAYAQCVYSFRLDLIMATSICAMISSILIGVFANLPLGMAPG